MDINQKVSEHLTLKDTTMSQQAIENKISNLPESDEILNTIKHTATNLYEPLYVKFGNILGFTNFFRNTQVNKLVGGVATSQHVSGEAIDLYLKPNNLKLTNKDLFEYIKENLKFDQLIWEFGSSENPNWVHCSYSKVDKNRKQILKSYYEINPTTKTKSTKYVVI